MAAWQKIGSDGIPGNRRAGACGASRLSLNGEASGRHGVHLEAVSCKSYGLGRRVYASLIEPPSGARGPHWSSPTPGRKYQPYPSILCGRPLGRGFHPQGLPGQEALRPDAGACGDRGELLLAFGASAMVGIPKHRGPVPSILEAVGYRAAATLIVGVTLFAAPTFGQRHLLPQIALTGAALAVRVLVDRLFGRC
jgi:hypothetical protein